MLDYLRPLLEPLEEPRFHFTRAWMQEQAARIADPRTEASKLGRQLNLPPAYLLIHRVTIGSIGVLCQLSAEARLPEHPRGVAPRFRGVNARRCALDPSRNDRGVVVDYLRRLQTERPVLFWVGTLLVFWLAFRLLLFVAALLLGPFALPSWAPLLVVLVVLVLVARRQQR